MSAIEKRGHILKIAEALFAQNGFNGTSVRDIAEAANVNISMISYYFGSKEGLMQALFQEQTRSVIPKMEQLVNNETLTPWQKLDILVDDYVQKAIHKIRFHKIMLNAQMVEKDPVIMDLLNQLRMKNMELIQRLISEGQDKGVFKKDVDAVLILYTMIGTVTQTFVNLEFYKKYYGLDSLPEEEVEEVVKKKISKYIKDLYKSILRYEA